MNLPHRAHNNAAMHMPVFTSKEAARAWGLQWRNALSVEAHNAISGRVVEHLLASSLYSKADTLLTYVGVKQGELDTRPLILQALDQRKRVLVPICRPGGRMVWSRLLRLEDLAETPWGILEPKADTVILETPENGVCVVPGICFRRDGHRIGFGAGFYDRFLRNFSGEPVALAPDFLTRADFPVELHDVAVKFLVTESGITTCSTSE